MNNSPYKNSLSNYLGNHSNIITQFQIIRPINHQTAYLKTLWQYLCTYPLHHIIYGIHAYELKAIENRHKNLIFVYSKQSCHYMIYDHMASSFAL